MLQHRPTERIKEYTLVRSFRPVGSQTVVWAENLATREMYYLLKWGDKIYLPVDVGDHIGIGVYNGSNTWRAYPTYVEALNIWEGGQSEPEDCDTNHMWEVEPYRQHVIDALMNPNAQSGRPLIVTRVGEGLTIGESTFDTTKYRGQIRVYERLERGGYRYRPYRPPVTYRLADEDISYSPYRGGDTTPRGFGFCEPLTRSADAHEAVRGTPTTRTRGTTTGRKMLGPDEGKAGIGAGAEEHRSHTETGVSYQTLSESIISLQVEFRGDLQPMLNRAWGKEWSFFWPRPHGERWFDEPWTWVNPRRRTTSSQVPVIRPHTGR